MLFKNKFATTTTMICALGLMLSIAFIVAKNNKAADNAAAHEVIIVGGGMAGALHALDAYTKSLNDGTMVNVTVCEKNASIEATTSYNIRPSFTPDEILSVVPRGKALVEKMQSAFNQPGGIRVDDVADVNNSQAAQHFMHEAEIYSMDQAGYEERTKTLLALGKMSMDLWQKMYDEADAELKAILVAANFNPCREPQAQGDKVLHDGYRVDLIYNVPNPVERAQGMKADYEGLGYTHCTLLSPAEVMKLDPFLTDFCKNHATADASGTLQWNNDCVALWRPGGCIDAKVFLPKLYAYLEKKMGNRFHIHFGKEVVGLEVATNDSKTMVTGLKMSDGTCMHSNKACKNSTYIFCPGEAVGTLHKFGLKEPAYAGFAGVSLILNIPVPQEKMADFAKFNHCMEVHQEGVVLAWQARSVEDTVCIGVAGTKAFYGDKCPTKDQAFAKNRNLLQLNMINDVLPQFISIALDRDTTGQTLTQADLDVLENKNIAKRWAGTRAVVFDGFPTLGSAYLADNTKIDNAIVTTHLGSGGVSFGPAAVAVSCSACAEPTKCTSLVNSVLNFAQANRCAQEVVTA